MPVSHSRRGSFGRYMPWTALAAIAALLLFSSHRWHVLGYLPLLFLLICPLLHFYLHGRHSTGAGDVAAGAGDRRRSRAPEVE